MRRTTTATTVLALSMCLAAIAAPTASAKGGGAERENPAPVTSSPAYVVATCDDPRITGLANPEELIINPLSYDAGCFAVRIHNGFYSVAAVVLTTGWTYENRSGSDGDRIKLLVSNNASGIKFTALVEAGRTTIG
ncbi:MAG: hypothetical protein JWM86_2334 [Thermoleophilia bacterium]|nr:hypothetical protein [Thermoleophilia bacterium]